MMGGVRDLLGPAAREEYDAIAARIRKVSGAVLEHDPVPEREAVALLGLWLRRAAFVHVPHAARGEILDRIDAFLTRERPKVAAHA